MSIRLAGKIINAKLALNRIILRAYVDIIGIKWCLLLVIVAIALISISILNILTNDYVTV
jgi:hypothetical protein